MRNIFWSMTLVVACLFGAATAQAQKQVTTNNAIVRVKYGTTPTVTPSMHMAAVSSTMKERTTGTVSTKKVKPSCPNGPHGNVTARM